MSMSKSKIKNEAAQKSYRKMTAAELLISKQCKTSRSAIRS